MVWQVEDDPTGGKFAGASNLLQGAAHKLEDIINFHAGDTVTALQRAAMQPGGREVILYGTVMGAIGTVVPTGMRLWQTSGPHKYGGLYQASWVMPPGLNVAPC